MGTAVAVTNGARGVMSIDLGSVNYAVAKGAYDKYVKSVGGASRPKNFPGDQISFKKGIWYRGFGDTGRVLKAGTELVFNIPNMMSGWVKWVENDAGKRYPQYSEMRFPAAGDDPIDRSTLGDDDESEWEPDEQGLVKDPWKPILAFPVRLGDDETVHHVLLETISKVIAGLNMYRDIIDEMKLHVGQLPVIEIGADKTSRDLKKKDKKGRERTEKQVWDIPTFEATGWADAIDADNPTKAGGVNVTADDDETADIGKVTAKARSKAPVGNGKANGKTKAIAAPVKGKAASRRTVEAVDDDENL